MTLQPELLARAPKALLHDHLDGGVRPSTVLELAREIGHELPVAADATAEDLATWFAEAADSGSLERYLETFVHTVAVMQTREALVRVAAECAEDLAEDGVVYAEVRYAPELFQEGGKSNSSLPPSQVGKVVIETNPSGKFHKFSRGDIESFAFCSQ